MPDFPDLPDLPDLPDFPDLPDLPEVRVRFTAAKISGEGLILRGEIVGIVSAATKLTPRKCAPKCPDFPAQGKASNSPKDLHLEASCNSETSAEDSVGLTQGPPLGSENTYR